MIATKCETLRPKDRIWTQLWKVLDAEGATKQYALESLRQLNREN